MDGRTNGACLSDKRELGTARRAVSGSPHPFEWMMPPFAGVSRPAGGAKRPPNAPRRTWTARAFAIVVLALVVLPVAGVGVGGAKASSSPSSNLTPAAGLPIEFGGFLTSDHHYLVFAGVTSWGGTFQPIANNSQVYASTIELVVYSLLSVPTSMTIELVENGVASAQTASIAPAGAPSVINVNVLPIHAWTNVELIIDNTPQTFSVAVPLSFLPSDIANVGGLDLIALAIISECLVALAIAVSLAYGFQRKALWAPKFSLLVWGHVILISLAAAILLDFQQVDELFAGWSPLFYAVFLFPIFFVFSLSFFNKARKVELLQARAPLAGRLSFHRWEFLLAKDLKGRWIIIGTRWGDWWARVFGHHVPLTTTEATLDMPEPFMADIVNHRVLSRAQVERRVRNPTPEKSSGMDDFDVIPVTLSGRPETGSGRSEPPSMLMFTPVGKPVSAEFPRLSFHRDKLIPPRLDRKTGEVIVPEHHARRLSLPHFTDGSADITLHLIHFRSAVSVTSGWRNADSLALLLNDTQLDLEALKSHITETVSKLVKEQVLARESLLHRGEVDLPPEEAVLESEREKTTTLPTLEELFGRGAVLPKGLSPQEGATPAKKRPKGA